MSGIECGYILINTKLSFVDKWPLFGGSETTYLIFTGQIKTGLSGQETATRR